MTTTPNEADAAKRDTVRVESRKTIAILSRAGANYVRLIVRGPGFPGGINTTWADETYHAGTKDPQ